MPAIFSRFLAMRPLGACAAWQLYLEAFDQPIEREAIRDCKRNADDSSRRQQCLPAIDVTAHQFGRHAGAHHATGRRADENPLSESASDALSIRRALITRSPRGDTDETRVEKGFTIPRPRPTVRV